MKNYTILCDGTHMGVYKTTTEREALDEFAEEYHYQNFDDLLRGLPEELLPGIRLNSPDDIEIREEDKFVSSFIGRQIKILQNFDGLTRDTENISIKAGEIGTIIDYVEDFPHFFWVVKFSDDILSKPDFDLHPDWEGRTFEFVTNYQE